MKIRLPYFLICTPLVAVAVGFSRYDPYPPTCLLALLMVLVLVLLLGAVGVMELILTRLRDQLDKQLPAPVPTSPCVMHYHRQSRYDYSEDWEHENGQYSCTCANCHQSFLGHKRRCLCRVCDPPIKSK